MKLFSRVENSNYSLIVLLLLSLLLACIFFTGEGIIKGSSVEASDTQPIYNLPIGARVMDPSWLWEHRTGSNYSGTGETKPVTWIVVAKDHYGSGSGVTLLAEELIGVHAFDNSTDRGSIWGSNHWGESGTTNATRGLRPWLNSRGIHSGEGFYRAFSDDFQAAVVQVSIPNKEWQAGGAYTKQDRVFIPSTTELGDTDHNYTYPIGTAYAYFQGANDADRIAQLGGTNGWYWTRSPGSYFSNSVRDVTSSGAFLNYGAYYGLRGVRPALNLKSEVLVSADTNNDDAYEIWDVDEPTVVEAVELKADPPEWQEAGKTMTFTAEVTKGNQNAEFRFFYRVPGSSWESATSYSTDNTWTVSTNYVGEVQVGVQARAIGSNVVAQDYIDYEIVATAPVEAVTLTADPPDSQLAGKPITFTAEVTEGNQDAEFRFYYRVPGGSWKSATSYSTNNTWTVSTSYVGEVEIGVIARAVGTNVFEETRDKINYEIKEEPEAQLPAEIELWIEQSKERFAAQALGHEGILYILVTYGEKPTAGYAVEITEIKEDEDKVVVTVHFTEPAEDKGVPPVITYPFDLAIIDDPGLPVEYNATGAETEIPVQE